MCSRSERGAEVGNFLAVDNETFSEPEAPSRWNHLNAPDGHSLGDLTQMPKIVPLKASENLLCNIRVDLVSPRSMVWRVGRKSTTGVPPRQ